MDSQRWAIVSPLLDELLELDDDARDRRLDELAASDTELASELKQWLARDEQQPSFLANPIIHAHVFSPQAGQILGPYQLETQIGEGGMGQVWRAVRADGLYQRRVALKLLRPGLGDAGLRRRFTRERQILARLGHAHIARLLDAGLSADGQPYLALDYIQGEPITRYADTLALGVSARLELFLQVCQAVSHAHANLVVHRDLKPSNILVTPAGDVCLLDFGIAKLLDEPRDDSAELTGTGARVYTLHYAAPEQLRREPVTTMTDVYAMGAVLYELMAGRKPYQPDRATDAAWEEAILSQDPAKPSQAALRLGRESHNPELIRRAPQLAGDLDNIILKALNKAPEQRYASAEALSRDVGRFIHGLPVEARAQSLLYRTHKVLHRHVLALTLIIATGAALLIAVTARERQANQLREQTLRADRLQQLVEHLCAQVDLAGCPASNASPTSVPDNTPAR